MTTSRLLTVTHLELSGSVRCLTQRHEQPGDRVQHFAIRGSCWDHGTKADAVHAASILEAGAAILAPVLAPAGFTFQLACQGSTSPRPEPEDCRGDDRHEPKVSPAGH
jgi:hypothetical protein